MERLQSDDNTRLLRKSCGCTDYSLFLKKILETQIPEKNRRNVNFAFPSPSSLPFSLLRVWAQYSLFELKSTK